MKYMDNVGGRLIYSEYHYYCHFYYIVICHYACKIITSCLICSNISPLTDSNVTLMHLLDLSLVLPPNWLCFFLGLCLLADLSVCE